MIRRLKSFIAISSVLVISAVVLIIGVSVALLAVSQLQMSFSGFNNDKSLGIISSCVDDALLRLSDYDDIPAAITVGGYACTINIESHVGDRWTFTVEGTFEGYYKKIRVVADRTTRVYII